MGEHVSVSVQGYFVAGTDVHQQVHGRLFVDVEVEVDVHVVVGGYVFRLEFQVFFFLLVSAGHCPVFALLIGDEGRVRKFVGRGGIVREGCSAFGACLDGDVGFAGLSFEGDFACGVDGAVEVLVAEVGEVVAQDVVALDADVVRHVLEAIVVEVPRGQCLMAADARIALWVVEDGVGEVDVVGTQSHGVVNQVVASADVGHAEAAFVHYDVAFDVNLLERSEDARPARGLALKVVEDD